MVAATTGETQPLLGIEFLHRVFDILEEYLGSVEKNTIKENFSTVYQLLEEMMDFGYATHSLKYFLMGQYRTCLGGKQVLSTPRMRSI